MRAGYIVETHGELSKNTVGIVVFNYDYPSIPCEVVNYIVPYLAIKKYHSNALGRWNVKLKNKITMEFKGTKGKWGINPKASRNVRCGGITIANCSGGQNGDNQEEEQANAKLIAAAPEMFEMLKDALNILEMSDLEGNVSFKIKDLLTKITQ